MTIDRRNARDIKAPVGSSRAANKAPSTDDEINRLIAACGGPITATSANLSGQPPAVTAAEVFAIFGDAVDLVLDGGPAPGGPGYAIQCIGRHRVYCIVWGGSFKRYCAGRSYQ